MSDPDTEAVLRQADDLLSRYARGKTESTRFKYAHRWRRLLRAHPDVDLRQALVDDPRTCADALLGLMHLYGFHPTYAGPAWSHPNATPLVRAHIACHTDGLLPKLADLGPDGLLFDWALTLIRRAGSWPWGEPDPLRIRTRSGQAKANHKRGHLLPLPHAVVALAVHDDLDELLAPLPAPARTLAITLGRSAERILPQEIIAAAAAAAA